MTTSRQASAPAARRSSQRGKASARVLVVLLTIAFGAVIAYAVFGTRRPPEGPVEVLWDREACGYCHMLVGDPAFAVQLHTAAGDVVYFDDPGCYFEYAAREHPAEHAVYFHELRGDRWLRRAEVAFVRVDRSPMAHHLGAVAAGTAGAISFEAARDQVLRDPPIPAPEGP